MITIMMVLFMILMLMMLLMMIKMMMMMRKVHGDVDADDVEELLFSELFFGKR